MAKKERRLILASASRARQDLLTRCGLEFEAIPAAIDEEKIIHGLQQKIPPEEIAAALAQQKAVTISARNKDAWVIGADQVLYCEGRIYSKAVDRGEAARNLKSLCGKTHQLISAACVIKGGKVLWSHADTARMTMKTLDDQSIKRYMDAAGDDVLLSVGGYMLERGGVWLFDRIDGSYFTILGIPLLPLLDFLAGEGWGP